MSEVITIESGIKYLERRAAINKKTSIVEREIINNNQTIAVQTIVEKRNDQYCDIEVNRIHCLLHAGRDEGISKIFLHKNMVVCFFQGLNRAGIYVWKVGGEEFANIVLHWHLDPTTILNARYCKNGLFLFPLECDIDSRLVALKYILDDKILSGDDKKVTDPSILEYGETERDTIEDGFYDPYAECYREQTGIQKTKGFRDINLRQYF